MYNKDRLRDLLLGQLVSQGFRWSSTGQPYTHAHHVIFGGGSAMDCARHILDSLLEEIEKQQSQLGSLTLNNPSGGTHDSYGCPNGRAGHKIPS